MSVSKKLTTIAENIPRVFQAGEHRGFDTGYHNGYEVGLTDGFEDGYTEGVDDGYMAGATDSWNNGYTEGYDKGKTDGYNDGTSEGYKNGHSDGVTEGFASGKEQGITEGKQAEQNRISDIVQQNGTRTDYNYGFAGLSWTDETFALVEGDIVPNGFSVTTNMFSKCAITDLRPSTTGKNIDLTHCSNLNYALAELVNTKYLGTVDVSKATYGNYVFSQSTGLMLIEKLILPTTKPGYIFGNTCFSNCTSLTEITEIEGYLFGNVSFQWCPLSVVSMKNIINALYPYAGTTNEGSYTIKFSDDCWAALEADSTAPDGGTWKEYVAEILGWNT